ncbi:glycosyltransferase family 2 protein [Sulfurospirillum sp. SCADC]|uniref:glycosyltransferase family 2 protein n=1 Tax=Sulfurospirillum sp. SCADC TaxID=1537915 RepID=UPI00068FA5DA|nr:glycosyltransferase family 2 protein [Sulfurospirillum sp. SCADC]
MKIQTIIPIFNPQVSFSERIVPLLQEQTASSALLVINSGDKDLTIAKSATLKIQKSEFNHANTRNLALNYEADFYLFMTQDSMPYDEFLVENLLKAFEDDNVVVAYARQIPYQDADAMEVFARMTNYPLSSKVKSKDDLPTMGIKTFFCSDSCAMYRASYFKEVSGFKKDLNTNEDMEFAARAIMDGKKVAYAADAKVYHSHTFTCKDIWKRYSAIGKFFTENSWILKEVEKYHKAESTGINQALRELKYLLKESPWSIPRSCLHSLIKFIAFKSAF